MDCIFCKIIAGEIPAHRVFEDNDFIAFLDIHPVNLGHTLLVPKAHHRNLLEMPEELLAKVGSHLKLLGNAVKTATKAGGLNIMANNEPAAGQLVFHTHIHIIPRFEGDGFKHWKGHSMSNETELVEVKEKITNFLVDIC